MGTFEGHGTAVTIGTSGCNLTVLTMFIRYLRRPKSDDDAHLPPKDRAWISVFDEIVDKPLDEAYRPFTRVHAFPRFSMKGPDIEAAAAALRKEHAGEWDDKSPKIESTTSSRC